MFRDSVGFKREYTVINVTQGAGTRHLCCIVFVIMHMLCDDMEWMVI
jgi:hypothetical protein